MTQLAEMVLFSSGGFTKLADCTERAGLTAHRPRRQDALTPLVPSHQTWSAGRSSARRPAKISVFSGESGWYLPARTSR